MAKPRGLTPSLSSLLLALIVVAPLALAGSVTADTADENASPTCEARVEKDVLAWVAAPDTLTASTLAAALAAWDSVCGLTELTAAPTVQASCIDLVVTCVEVPVGLGELCSGAGSTVLGWRWNVILLPNSADPIEQDFPDFQTSGEWTVTDPGHPFGEGIQGYARGLIGEVIIQDDFLNLNNAEIRFGPVVLVGDGSITPHCVINQFGVEFSDFATFFALSDMPLLNDFIRIGGDGTLCQIPC